MGTGAKAASSSECQTSHGPASGPPKNSQSLLSRCVVLAGVTPGAELMARAMEAESGCAASVTVAVAAEVRAMNWRRERLRVGWGFILKAGSVRVWRGPPRLFRHYTKARGHLVVGRRRS